MSMNSNIRNLEDLVQYSETSEYSFPKCIALTRVENIIIPDCIIYDKYRDIIFKNIAKHELTIEEEKKYKYHPDKLAMDIYLNPNLSHLLLYVNNCSELEFKPTQYVTIVDPDAINNVLKIILVRESSKTQELKKKALG